MSLLTFGIWAIVISGLLLLVVNMLPNAEDYPYPPALEEGITQLYSWLTSLNEILPLDTLGEVLYYGLIFKIFIHVLLPGIMWFAKFVRGNTAS